MALVVELSEDQLTVGAIQRTVSGLPEGFDLVDARCQWFDLVRAGAADDRTLGALEDSNSLALVTEGQAYLLLPHADLQQTGDDLDSSLIARVLESLPRTRSCTATASPRPWRRCRTGTARPPSFSAR